MFKKKKRNSKNHSAALESINNKLEYLIKSIEDLYNLYKENYDDYKQFINDSKTEDKLKVSLLNKNAISNTDKYFSTDYLYGIPMGTDDNDIPIIYRDDIFTLIIKICNDFNISSEEIANYIEERYNNNTYFSGFDDDKIDSDNTNPDDIKKCKSSTANCNHCHGSKCNIKDRTEKINTKNISQKSKHNTENDFAINIIKSLVNQLNLIDEELSK